MHTVSELMMVFEKIIEYGCRYCCVCLRLEHEKNLIVPKAFKAYIATLNNKNIDFTDTTRVCTICEEKAKAALCFLKAAHLAVSIQELFTDMLKEKSYRKEVQQHFNKVKVKNHFKALDEVEKQLRNWRTQTELVFTEVLLVENVDASETTNSSQQVFCTERRKKKLLVNKTRQKVLDIFEESKCSNPTGDDTVIVLDDDEVTEINDSDTNQNENPSVSIYRCVNTGRYRKRRRSKSKMNIDRSKLKIRNDLTNETINPTVMKVRSDLTNDTLRVTNNQNDSLRLTNNQSDSLRVTNNQNDSLLVTNNQNDSLRVTNNQNDPLRVTKIQSDSLRVTNINKNDLTNNTDDPLLDNPLLVQLLNSKKNNNVKDLQAFTNHFPMQTDATTSLNINNVYQAVPNIFIQPSVCNSTGNLIFPDITMPSNAKNIVSLSAPQVLIVPDNIMNMPQIRPVWPVKVTAGLPAVQDDALGQVGETPSPGGEEVPSGVAAAAANKCVTIQKGKFQGVEKGLVKRPVPKEVKIDWEDKIPMDVISFMESNNQNVPTNEETSSEFSSVGGITDVRSITDVMQGSEIPAIVDLCYLD